MSTEAPVAQDAGQELKRARSFSAAWLVLWLCAAIWSSHTLATAWPYVQLMPQWLLLFAVAGILYRGYELSWMRRSRERVQGRRRLLARVITFMIAIFIAGALWTVWDKVSMNRFVRAMAPLVEQVHARAACPPNYRTDSALAAYLDESGPPRPVAELSFDKARFVLVLAGRSMDIDGSALFYDSRTRAWKKVHNDTLAITGELEALRKGLPGCKLELRET